MKVYAYRITTDFDSWEKIIEQVSTFVAENRIPQENLINISVSEFGQYASTSTIIVWYWA